MITASYNPYTVKMVTFRGEHKITITQSVYVGALAEVEKVIICEFDEAINFFFELAKMAASNDDNLLRYFVDMADDING